MDDNLSNVLQLTKKYKILVNYNNINYLLIVNLNTSISDLLQEIYNYFKIDRQHYDLYYKSKKLLLNDYTPLTLLFNCETEKYPLLFLSSKTKKTSIKPIYSLTIYSNIPLKAFISIINKFFEYKKIPNNSLLKNEIRGVYVIKFRNSELVSEFSQFFEIYKNKSNQRIILPKIKKISRSISMGSIEENKKFININLMKPKKQFWLFPYGFKSQVGINYTNKNYKIIPNYVEATPSEPPVIHKFRDVSKDSWLDKNGFYL